MRDKPIYFGESKRVSDRIVQEMLGMIRGIVCDGVVTEAEVRAFRGWLATNSDCLISWPGNVLSERILSILKDNVISPGERLDLYGLFCDTLGEGDISDGRSEGYSTRLPFDDPPPQITFPGNLFCFTGVFVFGERTQCEAVTISRGGQCKKNVLKQPMTVVIGGYGSGRWVQSAFGRKIEEAMDYRTKGVPIQMVSEELWTEAVRAAPTIVA